MAQSPSSHAPPPVDERLIAPDTPYVVEDGRIVRVVPADEPHGTWHGRLAFLLGAHVAEDHAFAIDMLTRTSELDDIAPDASVFPRRRDPLTGGRQLEVLAFEIVSTQSLTNAARKASKLATRGVRRVFAIHVETARVLEWSADTWVELDPAGAIDDHALAHPMPVGALLDVTLAEAAVVEAAIATRHPVIERERQRTLAAGRADGFTSGVASGLARTIATVLESRGLAPTARQREQLLGERDAARLERWAARVALCDSVANLLREP